MFRDTGAAHPAGTYRAEWDGTGAVTFGFDARGIASGRTPAGRRWQQGASFSPFHPLFRERLAPFGTIRFMGMQETNTADIRTWADRRDANDVRQGSGAEGSPSEPLANGMSLEYMVQLANDLDADPWFNMPHMADDIFVRNFATYVRDHLEPGRKVSVEWSNEIWNFGWGFEASQRVMDQTKLPRNAGLDNWQVAGREAKRDLDIWSSTSAGQAVGTSVEWARTHQTLADTWSTRLGRDIQLVAYEGGPHMDGRNAPYQGAFSRAVNDQRMGEIYREHLKALDGTGMDLFLDFQFTGRPGASSWGDFAKLHRMDQPLSTAHRYAAVVVAANGTLWTAPARPPSSPCSRSHRRRRWSVTPAGNCSRSPSRSPRAFMPRSRPRRRGPRGSSSTTTDCHGRRSPPRSRPSTPSIRRRGADLPAHPAARLLAHASAP